MLFRQHVPPRNPIDQSILSTARHPIDIRPFIKHSKVQKSKPFLPSTSSINPSSINTKNQIINAIIYNSLISKLQLNPQFIQLLTKEYSMQKIVVISIWGSPKSGKSFLIDNFLSFESNLPYRVFSKAENKGANCSIRRIYTNQNNPLIFLDWSTLNQIDEELHINIFLLMYLISSAIIFNYSSNDLRYQPFFIQSCQKVKQKLTSNQIQYSLPQLISIRRDVNPSNNKSTSFIELVHKLQLFQPNSNLLYFNYPGNQSIRVNQLIDVPINTLDKHFIKTSHALLDLLKRLKPMYINDNPITANILSILVQSYVNMINRFNRVVIDNCWENVLEALAVNGFNNFVTIYTEYLQSQFKNQKSVSKYQLFRKLSKIKNQSNYKLQNFTNIKGDPIIDKYKDKLKQFVKGKEQMIKSINKSKSNMSNQKYVAQLRRSCLNSNQSVKEDMVFKYVNELNNMPEDYNRSEIVLGCMKELMRNQLKKLGNKVEAPQIKRAFNLLKQNDSIMNKKIEQGNSKINELQKKIKQCSVVNSRFKVKIEQKQLDLQQTIQDNIRKDQQRRDAMTANQREAQAHLFQLQQQQNRQIQKQNKIISGLRSNINDINLRLKKQEQERAEEKNKMQLKNQELNELDKKIKNKERVLKDRQAEVERLKELLAKPEKKAKTCGCFG